MWYVLFDKNGRASGMTAWSKYGAFDEYSKNNGLTCEPHDDWPEQRNHIDLFKLKVTDPPKNVSGVSVDTFLKKYTDYKKDMVNEDV